MTLLGRSAKVAELAAKAFFVVVIVKYVGNRRHVVKLRHIALGLALASEAMPRRCPLLTVRFLTGLKARSPQRLCGR
jgi:hypothetical protein